MRMWDVGSFLSLPLDESEWSASWAPPLYPWGEIRSHGIHWKSNLSGFQSQTGRFGEDISLLRWESSHDSRFVKPLVNTLYWLTYPVRNTSWPEQDGLQERYIRRPFSKQTDFQRTVQYLTRRLGGTFQAAFKIYTHFNDSSFYKPKYCT
jgi:hypothetical protein